MRSITLQLVSVLAISGCAAYKIPEIPQDHENQSSPIPIVVRSESTTENEQRYFVGALGVVKGVTIVDPSIGPQHGHIVAELKPGHDERCFSEPMLTVLTLGIIPSIGCAPHGLLFELSGGPLAEPTLVDTRGDVPLIWGWAAMFMLLSNDWVGERSLSEYQGNHLGEAIHRAVNAAPD